MIRIKEFPTIHHIINLYYQGLFNEALDHLRDYNDSSDILNLKGKMYFEQGEYDLAIKLFEKSLELDESEFGEYHPQSVRNRCNFALIDSRNWKLNEAIQEYERCFDVWIKNDLYDEKFFQLLNNYAVVKRDAGEQKSALAYLRKFDRINIKDYPIQEYLLDITKGMLYADLNNFRLAWYYYNEAFRCHVRNGLYKFNDLCGILYYNEACLHQKEGMITSNRQKRDSKYYKAYNLYLKALGYYKKIGHVRNISYINKDIETLINLRKERIEYGNMERQELSNTG